MLGADVAVIEVARFGHRQFEDLLGARRIGKVGPSRLPGFALLDRLLDLLLDVVQLDAEVLEHLCGDSFTFANQSEQNVLGAHVFVVQSRSFLAGHREDLAYALGEVVAVHSPLTSW